MAVETTAILRELLFQAMKAEDLDEAIDAIKAMCTKDDIAAVTELLHAWQKRKGIAE